MLAGLAPALIVAMFALLLAAPLVAQSGCPAPLPPEIFSTRCTGEKVEIPGREVVRDCPIGQRPARPMAGEILRLMEMLRCDLGDRVIITSAYRSPAHNEYLRAWVAARNPGIRSISRKSRHMQGAAVDFYIRGYGHDDLKGIAAKLQRWAGKLPKSLRGSRERVWVKVYRKSEGREPDNLHSHPYIHMELRR